MGEQKQGLYMISVAASLAGVHSQTLRIYEERHLIEPQRTPKGTRLYTDEEVETVRRIQELTDEGMNLAGVQRVFEMEAQLARMARRIRSLETQLEQVRAEALAEIDRVRRAGRAEIVRYQAPQPVPIPIQRSPIKREDSEEKEA